MVKCTWQKIYHLNLDVYSSVALSTIRLLCGHHHHPSTELFSSVRTEALYAFNSNSPLPLSSAPGNHLSTFCLYESDSSVSELLICTPSTVGSTIGCFILFHWPRRWYNLLSQPPLSPLSEQDRTLCMWMEAGTPCQSSMKMLVTQSCWTLCSPMDCSPWKEFSRQEC